jgi:hypothetical protein
LQDCHAKHLLDDYWYILSDGVGATRVSLSKDHDMQKHTKESVAPVLRKVFTSSCHRLPLLVFSATLVLAYNLKSLPFSTR